MGRKKRNYPTRQKNIELPLHICERLDLLPNQTEFITNVLETAFGSMNPIIEDKKRRIEELKLTLKMEESGLAAIIKQKEEQEVKEKELIEQKKKWYNTLCNLIDLYLDKGMSPVFSDSKLSFGLNCSLNDFVSLANEKRAGSLSFEKYSELLEARSNNVKNDVLS